MSIELLIMLLIASNFIWLIAYLAKRFEASDFYEQKEHFKNEYIKAQDKAMYNWEQNSLNKPKQETDVKVLHGRQPLEPDYQIGKE